MSDAETKRVAERTMGAAAVMRVAARVAVAAPTARAAGAKRRRGTKGHPLHGAAGWSTSWRCSPLRDGPSARASNPRCGAHGVDPRPCSRRDGAGNRLRQAAGGPTSAAPPWPARRDLPERPAIDLELSCDGGDELSPPSLRLRLQISVAMGATVVALVVDAVCVAGVVAIVFRLLSLLLSIRVLTYVSLRMLLLLLLLCC